MVFVLYCIIGFILSHVICSYIVILFEKYKKKLI